MMKRLLFTLTMMAMTAGLLAQEAYWTESQYRDDDRSYQRYDDDDRSYGRRDRTRIQMALILDTSGSMDDLIDQARGQMWSMVHEIVYNHEADFGEIPILEIALYEYGNSELPRRDDFIALHAPFTTDLDWIADELFSMRTSGRNEYHGAAVARAVDELRWSRDPSDLKLIFIAGNEHFAQGPVDYRRAMNMARSRGISVNTIYCGNWDQGQRLEWEEAAYYGGGSYLAIDQYRRDHHHDARFQRELLSLNQAYNATYIPYGAYGRQRYDRLCRIDDYAYGYGQTVIINRTLVKVSPIYVYPDWDLVDAYRLGRVDLRTIRDADLPPAMRGMSLSQRQAYLVRMQNERDRLRGEIRTVTEPRRATPPPRGSTGPATGSRPTAGQQPRRASEPSNLGRAVSESVRRAENGTVATPAPRRSSPESAARPGSTASGSTEVRSSQGRSSSVTSQRPVESRQPAATSSSSSGSQSSGRSSSTQRTESRPSATTQQPVRYERPSTTSSSNQRSAAPSNSRTPASSERSSVQSSSRSSTSSETRAARPSSSSESRSSSTSRRSSGSSSENSSSSPRRPATSSSRR